MKTFEELGLDEEIMKVLYKKGFTEPSEIQEKTIPLALAGEDIIGGSATGSGKTLAFSSAIIQNLSPSKKIQALILCPTRELAEQVASSITEFSNRRLSVTPIYGGVEIMNQMKKLHKTDVVVGTPGRILDHINRETIDFSHLKFLVLDEVDRMFDMGFRVDVEKILKVLPSERQTMLFSATISSDVDYLAKRYTKNPKEVAVKSYVDHSKLKQVYYDVPHYQKFSLLVHLLNGEKTGLVMVFCNTRKNADFVTSNLNRNGIEAQAIHGGLAQNKRIRVLEDFHKRGVSVLVCTDVAARGLDIKGVSHVYNYDIPPSSSEYIHRVGRTARAGKEGIAINIISDRDYDNFRAVLDDKSLKISEEKMPDIETVKVRLPERSGFGGRDSRGSRGYGRDNRSGRDRSESSRNSGGRDRRPSSRSYEGRESGRGYGRRDSSASRGDGRRSGRNESGTSSRSYGRRDSNRNDSNGRSYNSNSRNGDRKPSFGRSSSGRDSRNSDRRDSRGSGRGYQRSSDRRSVSGRR